MTGTYKDRENERHYTCVRQFENHFIRCDDTVVNPTRFYEGIVSTPLLLFYSNETVTADGKLSGMYIK